MGTVGRSIRLEWLRIQNRITRPLLSLARRFDASDLFILGGLGCVLWAISWLFGQPWALLAAGLIAIAYGFILGYGRRL